MDVDPTYENIKAPQFFDFENPEANDAENPEQYFEFDHETGLPLRNNESEVTLQAFDDLEETITSADTTVFVSPTSTIKIERNLEIATGRMTFDIMETKPLKLEFAESGEKEQTVEVSELLSSVHLDEELQSDHIARSVSAMNRISDALAESQSVESTPAPRRRSKSFSSAVSSKKLTLPETPEVLKRNFSKFAATKINADASKKTLFVSKPSQSGPMKPLQVHHPHMREDGTFAETESDFAQSLRSYGSQKGSQNNLNRTTNPAPFHFHDVRKHTNDSETEVKTFISMAEQVRLFEQGTPKRFRTSSRTSGQVTMKTQDDSCVNYRVTHAITPQLTAMHRHRKIYALSREEQEMKDYEEAQKHKFKAHPVNENILKPKSGPLVHHAFKEPTVPEPFKLTEVHHLNQNPEPDMYREFHARPVPRAVLAGPVSYTKKEVVLTVPQSPAFASKKLKLRCPSVEHMNERSSRIDQRRETTMKRSGSVDRNLHCRFGSTSSVGSAGSRSSASSIPAKRPPTTFEPFKVDERSKQMLAKRDEMIKKAQEEEAKRREFHAQPLPQLDKVLGLPERATVQNTVQKPFNLTADDRGGKLKQKLEEEQQRLKKEAEFKARPATVLVKEQFRPEPARKPLTDIKPFSLSSDQRAKAREAFDEYLKQKEAELEAARKQAELRKQEEEDARIATLRKKTVIKANPVPNYRSFIPEPSEKPLTTAKSPNFVAKTKKDKENHL